MTAELRRALADPALTSQQRKRIEIVALRLDGVGTSEITGRLGVSMTSVVKWPKRYREGGLQALLTTRAAVLRGPEPAEPGPPEAIRAMHWD